MKFVDFYDKLCTVAPLALSVGLCEKDGLYDNSGIIFTPKEEINGVVFALDLTHSAVKTAKDAGCDLIVTHHPAVYSPLKRVDGESPLAECIRNSIGVVSFHLNFDCARRGIDYYFAEGLGGEKQEIIEDLGEGTGYGRFFSVKPQKFSEFVDNYKKTFCTTYAAYYGDGERRIEKVASFCGAGLDEKAVDEAVKRGADVAASADVKHHVVLYALDRGLNVLCGTHYATENYGIKKICADFASEYNNKAKIIFCDDERLL